jgi:DNA-binding NarL/FixJ family response regulator
MKKIPRNTTKLGILLVDDHPSSRLGVRHMIETERDLEVCGEASTAAEALAAAIKLSPRLVISDVTLPERSGFDLVQDLAACCPEIPVLMLSMHSELTYARRALQIGACGYLMKSVDGDELLQGIRTVLRGGIHLSAAASQQMLEHMTGRSRKKRTGIEELTPREFEIFCLIGIGLSTTKIAERLNLSPKTIDTYRDRMKSKVGAANIIELVAISSAWLTEQSMTGQMASL